MITPARTVFGQRMRAEIGGEDRRIPVIVGLCGAGRTTILQGLKETLGEGACQYVNLERTATTPERFLRALTKRSPFGGAQGPATPASPREAFEAALRYLAGARCADGSPATFLIDEVMEFRTFESFPGLRRALPETLAALASAANRFVLASRYIARAARALDGAAPCFRLSPVEPLTVGEVQGFLGHEAAPLAVAVQRLTDGRPAYARAVVEAMTPPDGGAPCDPVAALAAGLAPEGGLSALCAHEYDLRLQQARGYGALKAILEVLAEEEPLTLTEISRSLGRTPGSTKDYLGWLDDVDLVTATRKRYRFRDPLLRVWCRLHCRADGPRQDEVTREVEAFASSLLEPSPADV